MKVICAAKECLDSSRVIDDNDLELISEGYLIPGALLGDFSWEPSGSAFSSSGGDAGCGYNW